MIRESNTMEYAYWLDKGPISYPISYFIHSDDQWNVWSNIMRLLLKLNFFLKLLLEQNYFISVICFTLHHINKAAWVCMSYNLLPLWICSNWIVIIKIMKIPSLLYKKTTILGLKNHSQLLSERMLPISAELLCFFFCFKMIMQENWYQLIKNN